MAVSCLVIRGYFPSWYCCLVEKKGMLFKVLSSTLASEVEQACVFREGGRSGKVGLRWLLNRFHKELGFRVTVSLKYESVGKAYCGCMSLFDSAQTLDTVDYTHEYLHPKIQTSD